MLIPSVIYSEAPALHLRHPSTIMFAEADSVILRPNGIQEMTTCTSHLPPPALRSTTLIFTRRGVYKYAALLGPNVCLVWAQKVALPQQLEEIGSICSLGRSADISSHLGGLGDVCWEIKQAWRSLCSAETDQRSALALVPLTPLSCLGYRHSGSKSWLWSLFLRFVCH